MDLNKAMVDLYKQRSAAAEASRHKALSAKRPKVEPETERLEAAKIDKKKAQLEELLTDFDSQTTFDQLHGLEQARDQIVNIIDIYKRVISGLEERSKWPMLIRGSKGLGKTSLVEAAANYGKLKLIPMPLKKLVVQHRTANEFEVAMKFFRKHCLANRPAIVLIDDMDRLTDKEELKLIIQQEIEEFLANDLLVFCTTSSTLDTVSGLDFSITIHLKRPNLEAREKILNDLCKNNKNLTHLSHYTKHLAMETPSFTASNLEKMLYIAKTKSELLPNETHCDQAVEVVKQSLQTNTHLIGERPTVTWNDIGGLPEVRREFKGILKRIRDDKIDKFAGIILYGPPGCGKTMVAQAMANEGGFNFISIKPSELVNKFLGETERNIRRVFSEAREYEPCMIYFDEFDGLCGTRSNKDHLTGAIQTLLSELDGFAKRGKSIILASTNRLKDIDFAMKRPGRLSEHIYVGRPDEKARRDILGVLTSSRELADDVDLDLWARKTQNFTGAHLDFLVSKAEFQATSEETEQNARMVLKKEHFEYSFNKIRTTYKKSGKKESSKCSG